jgi:uncharacterized repeat protein (TIGR03803 family)
MFRFLRWLDRSTSRHSLLTNWFAPWWMKRLRPRKTTKGRPTRPRPTARLRLVELEPRIAPATLSTLASLTQFPGGAEPFGGLVQDASGDLFGTTSEGGAANGGTVYELSPVSGGYTRTTLASFANNNGKEPLGGLVLDSSGDLFGTTVFGGASNDGTVFELSPAGGGYNLTTLVSFNNSDGAQPLYGSLALDSSSGDLFGTTSAGGASGSGTVFELSPAGGGSYNLTTLVSFSSSGASPHGGLVLDSSSGNLFGTTSVGGTSGDGTVFELSPAGGGSYNLTTLISFNNNTNGAVPYGDLVLDSSTGDLFGTTTDSPDGGGGTVFKLSPAGGGSYNLTTLAIFTDSDGDSPTGGLVLDGSSNLFGTTSSGGASENGTVFELSPAGGGSYNLISLISFNTSDGAQPYGNLALDSRNGNLFGTTSLGGSAASAGTVFELSPTDGGSYSFTTLANFARTEGIAPGAGLILDTSTGDLFGTTSAGGLSSDGTVFELSPAGAGYDLTTLFSFSGGNGINPDGSLILDGQGDLYGTTVGGGSSGDGTVFELSPVDDGYNLTTLVSFSGTNGLHPSGSLILDSSGDLFGTTSNSVFELSPVGGAYILTTLASTGGDNLVLDSATGDLFGTTPGGGDSNDGTVFQLSPTGGGAYRFATLVSFAGSNGRIPESLVMDAKGNLFGTTNLGGLADEGTVFMLTPVGGGIYNLTTLVSLNLNTGTNPDGLTIDTRSGDLFGTNEGFDSIHQGSLFELSPVAGGYTFAKLMSFSGSNGSLPQGSLVMDSLGRLFGTTASGGSAGEGTVFEVTIPQSTPTITTAAGSSVTFGAGQPLTASATLSGGDNPTGTITFTLDGPNSTIVDTETVPVDGDGTYQTPTGYLPTGAGTISGSPPIVATKTIPVHRL